MSEFIQAKSKITKNSYKEVEVERIKEVPKKEGKDIEGTGTKIYEDENENIESDLKALNCLNKETCFSNFFNKLVFKNASTFWERGMI